MPPAPAISEADLPLLERGKRCLKKYYGKLTNYREVYNIEERIFLCYLILLRI